MEKALIYQRMCEAMADVEAISKDKVNPQQHFKYRGIDDVMNALFPVFQKHRLFLVPEVLEHHREDRQSKGGGNLVYSILKIRYSLFTDDGSHVSAVVIGEGMDSADKSSNKAMSVAMKYAIFQMFCIPTEEMGNDDPDGYSPDPKPVGVTKSQTVPPVPGVDRRAETERIMKAYDTTYSNIVATIKTCIEADELRNINGDMTTMSDADFMRCMAAVEKRFRGAVGGAA